MMKTFALLVAAALSFGLAVYSAFTDRTPEFFGFLATGLFFVALTVPNLVSEITLPLGMGLKLQEIKSRLDEARLLAKQVATIGLHLIHSTSSFLPAADREVMEIDALRQSISKTLDAIGVPEPEMKAIKDYERTCYSYLEYLKRSLGMRHQVQVNKDIARLTELHSPAPIPPDELKATFENAGVLHGYLKVLSDDYCYFYTKREHLSPERWRTRNRWPERVAADRAPASGKADGPPPTMST